jgi:hypothetical protein
VLSLGYNEALLGKLITTNQIINPRQLMPRPKRP